MWYSVHDKETLSSFGVFTESQQLSDTQIQLEWSEDPAIVGEWIKPHKDPETGEACLVEDTDLKLTVLMSRIRRQRDALLTRCDWTQFTDVNLPNKTEWAVYRQALRDLPANTQDPMNPVWPIHPTSS